MFTTLCSVLDVSILRNVVVTMSLKKKAGNLWFELALPPLVLLLMMGLVHTKFGMQLENLTLDWRFQSRGASDSKSDSRITVVGIEEEGLAQWGRWPWSRNVHADFMKLLATRPPKAVAFDLFFSEPSKNPSDDQNFGDALVQIPGAITGATAEETLKVAKRFESALIGNTKAISKIKGDVSQLVGHDTALFPIPIIAESSFTGFVNSPPDADGMRRKLPVVVRCGTRVFPSLVLQSVLRYEGVDGDAVEVELGKHVRLKGAQKTWVIPVDERGRMTINYRHPDTFTSFPYFRLAYQLVQLSQGVAWPKDYPPVEGQILIVGQTASGLTDMGPTPHEPTTPLVLVHANALNNILTGDYIKEVSALPIIAGWILLAFVTLIPSRNGPIWLAILAPLALIAIYVVVAFKVFAASSLQLPIAWPVIGFALVEGGAVVQRLVSELRAKARIKGMFGTYLSPQVVEQMVASGEEPKLGGQQCEITAFFSDIAGFSSFSEVLTPEKLVTLMNDYLTEMTDILHENGGTLDKFIGDAIVGMFGAPLPFAAHAYQACRAAIQMQKRQLELREKWRQEEGWPDIVFGMLTRIGLNSGPAIIGNMGSRRRFNYTMMGDTVNLAARSESGAKAYGVFSMITGETKLQAEKHKDDIAFRFLDKIVVKGRSKPAEVYELIDFKSNLSSETLEGLELFRDGIDRYLVQDWDAAREFFQRSARLERNRPGETVGIDTNPSLLMIKRCDAMKEHPPGADWDGVYVMKSK